MKVVGYSGTPLYKKLGMKAGALWMTVNAPDGYIDLLGEARDVAFIQAKANR